MFQFSFRKMFLASLVLVAAVQFGGRAQASDCYPNYTWRTVVTYVTVQQPYHSYVVRYKPCGTPYQVHVVKYRTVRVPVEKRVRVYH
jgi:hypothetical protein